MAEKDNDGLAYFLVCYRSVDYVSFLIAAVLRPIDWIIIHCDAKAPTELQAYVAKLAAIYGNIRILPTHPYSWAGYSHVEVSLRAIEMACDADWEWQHFVFLSEEHLPLASPADIARRLPQHRSMISLRPASQMGGDEHDDIANRYGAIYRELPGVGSFAVAPAPRDDAFFERIYHGTNWMVLHRQHCRFLLDQEAANAFDLFKTAIHAEENAIQSVLRPCHHEIVPIDPTLVAFPHLTDNHGLVMNEAMFRSALGSDHLYIRKRTPILSEFVEQTIRSNHFADAIREIVVEVTPKQGRSRRLDGRHALEVIDALSQKGIEAHRIDPAEVGLTPTIHVIATSAALRSGTTVRILSEDAIHFRVFIAEEQPFAAFRPPVMRDGYLDSTIRIKVYGLFGYRDILPVSIEEGGFVRIEADAGHTRLIALVERMLEEGIKLTA